LSSVTSIREGTFSNCSSLTEINLPSATSIAEYSFYNCTSLIKMYLCASVSVYLYDPFNQTQTSNIDLYLHPNNKPSSGNTWQGNTFKSINVCP
jgi:hypothetical protein